MNTLQIHIQKLNKKGRVKEMKIIDSFARNRNMFGLELLRVYQLILLYYGGCTVCRQVSQNYSGFDMITGDQTPYVFLIGNVFIVVWWWLTGVASVVVVVEYHWSGMFPSVHDESVFQVIWITSWKLYSSFFKREVYLKKGPASKLRTHFRN